MSLRFSIVINTYNRAESLAKTLAALRYLDYPDFEVIVVNGPSTDGTAEVLDHYAGLIKVGTCPLTNLSMSRNIGIAMAAGDIVTFIDDDAIPEPDWLTRLATAYVDDEVAAAGGSTYDPSGYTFQMRYVICNRFGGNRLPAENPTSLYNIPLAHEYCALLGTNCSFRRDRLLEVGGFDEEYVYFLDETDVCLRLIDHGYTVVFAEGAYVHHKFAPSHLRSKKVNKEWYPIVRSLTYFCIKHNIEHFDIVKTLEGIHDAIARVNERVTIDYDEGLYTDDEYAYALERIKLGVKDGMTDGFALARQLITPECLARHAQPFLGFHGVLSPDSLTICFITHEYPPDHYGGIARIIHLLATEIARLGHRVYVITQGHDIPTVDFEDGVWVHRVIPGAIPPPPPPKMCDLPPHFWKAAYAFYHELLRIHNEHSRVDIVEVPIWDVDGIACLMAKLGMLDTAGFAQGIDDAALITCVVTTYKLSLATHKEWLANKRFYYFHYKKIIRSEQLLFEYSDFVRGGSQAILSAVEDEYGMAFPPGRAHRVYLGSKDVPAIPYASDVHYGTSLARTSSALAWHGAWDHGESSSTSAMVGARMVMTATRCTAVRIAFAYGPDAGAVEIRVNGGSPERIDLRASESAVRPWIAGGLSLLGENTIDLTVVASDSAEPRGATVAVHRLAAERDPRLVMPREATNVLFVGRLEDRKGIDVLLACIPEICAARPHARFIIVGDDTLFDHYTRKYPKEEFLRRHRGQPFLEQVVFTGKVDDEELLFYYAHCDLFVAPSRFESFGLIFTEAMRYAKPVIGCRAGGMVEVIQDGVNGRLAEPGDVPTLRTALAELIDDPQKRQVYGANGRRIFDERFSSDTVANATLRFYRECAATHGDETRPWHYHHHDLACRIRNGGSYVISDDRALVCGGAYELILHEVIGPVHLAMQFGPRGGRCDILVDGAIQQSIDTYNPVPVFRTVLVPASQASGPVAVTLKGQGKSRRGGGHRCTWYGLFTMDAASGDAHGEHPAHPILGDPALTLREKRLRMNATTTWSDECDQVLDEPSRR